MNTRVWQRAIVGFFVVGCCGLGLPGGGAAQAAKAAPATATAAAAKSGPPAAAVACQACHGARGEGMAPTQAPRIAGQTAYYLDKQLRDFASGSRENAIMSPLAKTLSESDRSKVAAYFATLPVPAPLPGKAPTPGQAALGHQLSVEGLESRHVQGCNNCHGPEGSGVALSAPMLAGQSAAYLATQLKSWQQGTRKNDAGSLMSSVATRLDDGDIAAVASYYASLGSPSPGAR
jgi:cytochrome c553